MAQEMPSAAAAGHVAKSSRRKRKRADEQLDPAESLRRQKQRQAQALALKLRAEGKDYRPPKSKNKPIREATTHAHDIYPQDAQPQKKSRNGSAKHQTSASSQEPYKEETGSRPEENVQVIIVPIFWNKKADEKATVLAAAEEVQSQLQEQGISVGLDSTNADTPGQKYRYWEQKGVKVRVELGPRDAHKSQACLAISTTPGEVAKKSTCQIGESLTEAVQKALSASGEQPKAAQTSAAAKAEQPPADYKLGTSKKHKQQKGSTPQVQAVDDALAAGHTAAHEEAFPGKGADAKQVAAKAIKQSGDDLGDEFDIDSDAAEDEGSKKKKKGKSADEAGSVVDKKLSKPKGKEHKVVQF